LKSPGSSCRPRATRPAASAKAANIAAGASSQRAERVEGAGAAAIVGSVTPTSPRSRRSLSQGRSAGEDERVDRAERPRSSRPPSRDRSPAGYSLHGQRRSHRGGVHGAVEGVLARLQCQDGGLRADERRAGDHAVGHSRALDGEVVDRRPVRDDKAVLASLERRQSLSRRALQRDREARPDGAEELGRPARRREPTDGKRGSDDRSGNRKTKRHQHPPFNGVRLPLKTR